MNTTPAEQVTLNKVLEELTAVKALLQKKDQAEKSLESVIKAEYTKFIKDRKA